MWGRIQVKAQIHCHMLSLEVLCGYTYLQVSYKVHLLSMKATQAQESAQVQETDDREKRAETTGPATDEPQRTAMNVGGR